MKATKEGLLIRRQELTAMLHTASKEATDRNQYGVLFVVKKDLCFARASNGIMSAEAKGNNEGLHDGEWFVHRDFLVAACKLCTGKRAVVLEFSGASLHNAAITENGKKIEELSWEGDGAALAQVSFPAIAPDIKIPSKRRTVGHHYSIAIEHADALKAIAKAASVSHVTFYPPTDPETPVVFSAGDESDTQWAGCIRPTPAKAAEDDDDEGAE